MCILNPPLPPNIQDWILDIKAWSNKGQCQAFCKKPTLKRYRKTARSNAKSLHYDYFPESEKNLHTKGNSNNTGASLDKIMCSHRQCLEWANRPR